MKRLIIGLIALVGMLMVSNALADVAEKTVPVKLVVLEIIELDVTTPEAVIPDAEDYARQFSCLNDVHTNSQAPSQDYGFADRHDAIEVNMFTNAKLGATVHIAGKPNPEHDKSLLCQDVYLTVMRDKTYVLANSAAGKDVRNVTGGIDGAWANANTTVDGSNSARWVQCDTEAREFFGVTEKTEATRLWVLKLGIASLAEYESNLEGYEMDLTFILMPKVV